MAWQSNNSDNDRFFLVSLLLLLLMCVDIQVASASNRSLPTVCQQPKNCIERRRCVLRTYVCERVRLGEVATLDGEYDAIASTKQRSDIELT